MNQNKIYIVIIVLLLFVSGCMLFGGGPESDPEQKLFMEMTTAINSRAYESSIASCERFLARYPKSNLKDSVLMRLGESYEGLLKRDYQERITKGMDEKTARASFLAKQGHYNCWEVRGGELRYNKQVFRRLLEEFPLSHYADEATYNLIPWERDYDEDPYRVKKEINGLNEVLTKYPNTSYRPRILYEMGYRFQVLYELYSFAKDPGKQDKAKAQESYRQSEYLYNLCLGLPEGEYSKKALQNLDLLRQGVRIYLK